MRLEVPTNGLSLMQEQEHTLFVMFRRLHTYGRGTGVSLYMVRRIGENAGGSIQIESQVPIMNGIEFLQAYQLLPLAQRRNTTVMVLSTSVEARDLSHLDELPAASRLNKPLTPEKLATVLHCILSANKPTNSFSHTLRHN